MKKILLLSGVLFFIVTSGFAQKRSSSTQSRSAKSGRYVTKSYADKHKSTTYTSKRRSKY